MSAVELGCSAYVSYVGHDLYHERIILAWIAEGECVVLTPDSDIYIERLDSGNQDLDSPRVGGSEAHCHMVSKGIEFMPSLSVPQRSKWLSYLQRGPGSPEANV
eukprot:6460710-Amphidinium_carterae.1